jgi:hypothetical protein
MRLVDILIHGIKKELNIEHNLMIIRKAKGLHLCLMNYHGCEPSNLLIR